MRTLLLSLVLTLAVTASLLVIVERLLGRWGPDAPVLTGLNDRLERVEKLLTEGGSTPPADEPPASTPPRIMRGADATPDRLGEIRTLCTELQGMILDLERDQRRDLNRIYTQLLQRIEELGARGGGGAAAEADPAMKAALRSKLSEMGVVVHEEEGMVELNGRMGSPDHPLEFIACAPGGKLHEALLVLDVVPSALKIGLEDIGLVETNPEPGWRDDPKGAYIYVLYKEWKKPRRVEAMIENRKTGETLSMGPFVFTASFMETDPTTWERYYAADAYKHVIALTSNFAEVSVLACSRPEAEEENIWWPLADFNPPAEAPVKVFLRREAHPEWDKLR